MYLTRFRRKSLQDALCAVRDTLGPEALVLSTREVTAEGLQGWLGRREVEVTATGGRTGVPESRHLPSAPSVPHTASSDRRAGQEMTGEVRRATAELIARLTATGMDPETATAVVDAHPAQKRRGATIESLRGTLEAQVGALVADADEFAPVEVFVGPPGVGKTTTIAKIAARERARGGRRLGLVAADAFRVGAVEQLRLFADILGTPFTTARTPSELEQALDGGRRSLLLDTAGRSPSDDVARDMFKVLAGRAGVRTHLVIAANTPRELVRRVFDRFDDARPSRVVITKLDEAESLASLLPVLWERGLPVSYLGTGQHVPTDLERATPAALAAWIAGDVPAGAVA